MSAIVPAIEARLTRSPFVAPEMWQCGPRDEEGAAQVDGLLEVPRLRLGLADRAGDPDPGRVDQHVEAAVGRDVLGDEPRAILLGRHVRLRRSSGLKAVAGRLEPFQLAARRG